MLTCAPACPKVHERRGVLRTSRAVPLLRHVRVADARREQTPYNYHRALVWTAVMTSLAHLDPDFGSVFAIEAVNGQCGRRLSLLLIARADAFAFACRTHHGRDADAGIWRL